MKISKFLLFFLLALPFLIIIFAYFQGKSKYSGKIIIKSNRNYGEVTIYRDDYGIPSIKAQNLKDVLYGQGFSHAQDRLFQLHLNRMIPQGRLSEVFGSKMVGMDKKLRTIGINRVALKNLKCIDQEHKELLQAYADGVNDYVAQLSMLPLEFQITSTKFHEWTLYDSLSFLKIMNLQLSLDFQFEGLRSFFESFYGRQQAEIITANRGESLFENTTIMNDEELKQMNLFKQFQQEETIANEFNTKGSQNIHNITLLASLEASIPEYINRLYLNSGGGSNAWVISGKHTNTGKPILANDPHLSNSIPSGWYLNQLIFDDPTEESRLQIVSGASMPGGPGIFVGRNNHIAVGMTTLYADVTDQMIETIVDNQYLYDGQYYPLQSVIEIIKVKGEQEIEHVVRFTHNGPIFENGTVNFVKHPVSFKWPGHIENDTVFESVIFILKAKNYADLEKGFYKAVGPPQAIAWATKDGQIGFHGNGRIPIRKSLKTFGFLNNGSDKENQWLGYVSKEDQPRVTDPKKGFVVVANNKFATDNIKNYISYNVATTSRAHRITQMINEIIQKGQKVSVEDIKRMQSDVTDSYSALSTDKWIKLFEQYSKKFLKSENEIQVCQEMINILKTWDHKFTTDSVGASIKLIWEYQLRKQLFHEMFDNSEDPSLRNQLLFQSGRQMIAPHFIEYQIKKWSEQQQLGASWCKTADSKKNANGLDCVYQLVISLLDTHKFLQQKLSTPKIQNWQYGKLHYHTFSHRPFSEVPFLKSLYSRSYQAPGSSKTVHVSGINEVDASFTGVHGANLKFISSMDDNDASFWLIDTGISENVFSKHYDDQLKLYKKHQYLEINRNINKIQQQPNVLKILQEQRQNSNPSKQNKKLNSEL